MPLKKIRARLIAVVTLLLAGAFVATNLISYEVSRQTVRKNVLENELPLTGDTIYSEIQVDLVRPIFVASLMASDTFLRDWVLNGEREPERVVRYLDEIRARYDAFTAFFVSERTRNYYHFTGVTKQVSREDPRDEWFFRVREMDAPYEINVDPSQAQDDAVTIFINYRVMDYAGNFIGVTGVGLKLDAVSAIVDRYRGVFGRTVYFVNGEGRVTVHPNPDRAYTTDVADIPGMAPYAEAIMSGERQGAVIERPGGNVLMTTRYIPDLDWTLVVEEDESEALTGLDDAYLTNFAIGLAAILGTGLAIVLAIDRYHRRLEDMATIDTLTGLANRQYFDSAFELAVHRMRRSGQSLSLIMLDLDRFKLVNDRHGHQFGDRVLQTVARVVRERVRRSDVVARWGGEEFVVLMEDCARDKAREIADAIRQHVESDPGLETAGPEGDPLTVSLGVVSARETGESDREAAELLVDRLVGAADAALYRAKANGRNRVEVAEGEDTST